MRQSILRPHAHERPPAWLERSRGGFVRENWGVGLAAGADIVLSIIFGKPSVGALSSMVVTSLIGSGILRSGTTQALPARAYEKLCAAIERADSGGRFTRSVHNTREILEEMRSQGRKFRTSEVYRAGNLGWLVRAINEYPAASPEIADQAFRSVKHCNWTPETARLAAALLVTTGNSEAFKIVVQHYEAREGLPARKPIKLGEEDFQKVTILAGVSGLQPTVFLWEAVEAFYPADSEKRTDMHSYEAYTQLLDRLPREVRALARAQRGLDDPGPNVCND